MVTQVPNKREEVSIKFTVDEGFSITYLIFRESKPGERIFSPIFSSVLCS